MSRTVIKELVLWAPQFGVFLKQLLVSVISYLTLPFFTPDPEGVKKFFHGNYFYHPDGLIFDGATSGYFSKIEKVIDLQTFSRYNIIDLGCGVGSLYYWLKSKKSFPRSYLGLDFAVEDHDLTPTASIRNSDITVLNLSETAQGRLYFMCNVLCYLSNNQITWILNELLPGDMLIIIDPAPNVFWDAHFYGIKPTYRSIKSTCQILEENSFKEINTVQDYFCNIGRFYIFPASYCVCSVKK